MTRAQFFAGASAVLSLAIIDAVAKWWAIGHFGPANSNTIPAIFAFALHKNPGIAFDIPVPFFIILPLTLAIIVLFGSYFGRVAVIKNELVETLACFMVCLGALGNFFDRFINGFTTDYLIIFHTSAINISDLLILLGMLCFLWYHKSDSPVEKI